MKVATYAHVLVMLELEMVPSITSESMKGALGEIYPLGCRMRTRYISKQNS